MHLLCSLAVFLYAIPAAAVSIEWATVGNPGNACDPQSLGCWGAVEYSYRISTYEVTNAQYAEFLNAKATTSDPLGLYNSNMGTSALGGLTRNGSPGGFTYSVVAGRENMPVTYVSFYDAIRFANWLGNGQGDGDTETGAYTLLGGTPKPSNGLPVTRNPDAMIFLTSEDEWYKAAYFDSLSASYFDYPAGFDARTACASPGAALNTANCGDVVGDFTQVGSYIGSPSPYETFDQGGNASEWTEKLVGSSGRQVRGGSFPVSAGGLLAANTPWRFDTDEAGTTGFRVAAVVPEPSTAVLFAGGLLVLAMRSPIEKRRLTSGCS